MYGGVFIACCISLAFVEQDIPTILRSALTYIPEDCEYARVVKAVQAFHKEHPGGLARLASSICTILSVTTNIRATATLSPTRVSSSWRCFYGNHDFSRTLNICNMCGWDRIAT